MACGATLKRPMEFEAALLSPGSPKRRRCAPLPGPAAGLRLPHPPPPQQPPPPPPPQPMTGADRRLPTPEQIFWNIKQEYSRYQRRRQLEGANQSDACAPESHSHSSILTAPSSPEQYESFVKFTHDQIMRRYGARPTSYVS
uniref:Akirin 1 n=1 Tax=Ornithorhynchus anatinus TaxID=9258 RepID=A0A6I8MY18_ORNAN